MTPILISRIGRRRDERGSTLVMALVFLAVFSIFLSVLLPFGSTGFRLSTAVKRQRQVVYAADAVIESNIKALQPSNGDCSQLLPSFPAFDGQTVTITCSSGTSGTGPPVNTSNRPGQAILTLGRSATETGLNKSVGSTTLKVKGGVFSNSNITASGSILVTKGNVRARTGCTGISLDPVTTTTTTPPYTSNCSLANAVDPSGDDPNYAPAVSSPPAAAPPLPTTCLHTVALTPGTYNDAAALTSLMNNCDHSVVWFQPGVYYFNFTNAGSHDFTINSNNSQNVVAGSPKGWAYVAPTGAVPDPPRPTVAIPGGCLTEADVQPPPYAANIGVQFILGGDSTFTVKKGQVEICAQPSTTSQQIALYGVRPRAAGEPATAFNVASGCVTAVPPATVCDVVTTGPGNGAVLVVQGTVYLPAGSISLNMPNASIARFFGRGIIVRKLDMSIPASQSGNTGIEIPDFSAGTTTGYAFQEALLTASVNGVVRIRARVHFENTPPTPTVTVIDWSITP